MENDERLRRLTSGDTAEILATLREIQLDKQTPPSTELVGAGQRLLENQDADVRHAAIWAFALHWGCLDLLPMLRAILQRRQEDVEVRIIAARSLGSMLERSGRPDEEGFRILASVALEEDADAELRGVAYTSLRSAAGLLSAQERARLTEDIRLLDVDWEWLHERAG